MTGVQKWHGVYEATVTNNVDPTGQYRVQAKVPQVLHNAVSHWARPLDHVHSVPTVGQRVHVQFKDGDPSKPVYTVPGLVAGGSSPLPISEGGTGATTAAAALAALGGLPLTGGTLSGGLTISAGGLAVTGNVTINGTLNMPANSGAHVGIDALGNIYTFNSNGAGALLGIDASGNLRVQAVEGPGGTAMGTGALVLPVPLAISSGGTGATTAAAALTALGGAALAGAAFTGAVTAPSMNINGGRTGNVFSVGVGPSDFAGTVYLEDTTQPATPGTSSAVYSSSGQLKFVGEDGNAYNTSRKSVVLYPGQVIAGQTTPSYVNVTSASVPVGVGHYRLKATIIVSEGGSTGAPSFQLSGPSATGGYISKSFKNVGAGTTSMRDNTYTTATTAMNTGPMATMNGNGQVVELDVDATFTASGTWQLGAENTTASGSSFTITAVYIDLFPVV